MPIWIVLSAGLGWLLLHTAGWPMCSSLHSVQGVRSVAGGRGSSPVYPCGRGSSPVQYPCALPCMLESIPYLRSPLLCVSQAG